MRHGDRIDTADISWAKHAVRPHDPGLSEEGVANAKAAGARLSGEAISRIFTSPYRRCLETAAHVAAAIGASVAVEPGVAELQHPDWGPGVADMLSEVATDEADRLMGGRLKRDHSPLFVPRPPETIDEAFERAARTVEALLAIHPGTLLVVGHAVSVLGVVKGLASYPGGVPCPYASLFRLDWRDGGWAVGVLGETTHVGSGTGPVLVEPPG